MQIFLIVYSSNMAAANTLYTNSPREGIVLNTNWLQKFKELVKLSNIRNFQLLAWNFKEMSATKTGSKIAGSKSATSHSFFAKCRVFKAALDKSV